MTFNQAFGLRNLALNRAVRAVPSTLVAGVLGASYNGDGFKTLSPTDMSGVTPLAGVFMGNHDDDFLGTSASDSSKGFGVSSGSTESAIAGSCNDNDGTSSTGKHTNLTRACFQPNGEAQIATAEQYDGYQSTVSMVSGGINFYHESKAGAAAVVAALALGGEGIEHATGEFDGNATIGNETIITLGFRMKAMIFFFGDDEAWNGSNTVDDIIGIGFCDGNLNQGCMFQQDQDNQATTKLYMLASDSYAVASAYDGATRYHGEVTEVNNTQVKITTRLATGNRTGIRYLALGGTMNAKVVNHTPAGASGSVAVGFPAKALLKLNSTVSTFDSITTSFPGNRAYLSMGMASKAGAGIAQYSFATRADDNAGTTNTSARADSGQVSYLYDGTNAQQMEIDAFTDTGYDWTDHAGVDLATYKHIDLVLG